tara:strand:+ start:798 stop:1529 length:732 start_codon:yes stop_codon:yes gene_type:complete
MRVNKKSLKKLLGKGSEAVVYGLVDCQYLQVREAINNIDGVRAYDILDYEDLTNPIPMIDVEPQGDFVKRCCKAGITSIVIENYRRSQQGRPLVPLIFCVELRSKDQQVVLNAEQVATRSGKESSVTDAELRRCFKSYYEMGPQLKKIAEQTFKFVCVQEDAKGNDLFHLKELTPFWHCPKWQHLWAERREHKQKKNTPKQFPWRKVMASKTSMSQRSKSSENINKRNIDRPSSVKKFFKISK